MNNKQDFLIAQNQHWYRIPVKSAPKNLRNNVHLKYLAFYHTKSFELEKYSIRGFAEVQKVRIVKRKDLFPEEPIHEKTELEYYKLELGFLQALEEPVLSKTHRRITFIPTTEKKFFKAKEINYLFNDSIIEDEFWEALLQNNIPAERQYHTTKNQQHWFLDFAILCQNGKIAVECDGDEYHSDIKDVKRDKNRDNQLESLGWSVFRFTSFQIKNELKASIDIIKDKINNYSGVKKR
ncbi:MAG: DUF559 domain-containing protein [Microscillaceae bacterium]|nr:DUF559 domain-containing protein [Microscillaceae bacterium]